MSQTVDTDPRRADRPDAGRWRPPEGLALSLAAVALIYAAHIFYAALVSDVALAMDAVAAVILMVLAVHPRFRGELARLRGLALPGLAFAATIGVAVWTLTPYVPGGSHPVWGYIGVGPPALTVDKSTTLVEIIKLLGLACLFLVGAVTGASDARARTALNLILLGGALFGLWAFFGHVTGALYQTQPRRLEAHFLNPNTAGTMFGALLVLATGVLVRRLRAAAPRARLTRALPLVTAMLVFLVCLIATASRGAAMATLLALAGFLALQVLTGRWRVSRAMLGGVAALAILAALIVLSGDVLIARLFGTEDAAVQRAYIWARHWDAFLASPLFGYGLGNFEAVNRSLISGADFDQLWNIRAALNLYLQWLEQAGLAGALPMFLCVAAILAATFAGALRRSRMTDILFALLAADLLILAHGATDFAVETPSFSAFWAYLLGLQFAVAQGSSAR